MCNLPTRVMVVAGRNVLIDGDYDGEYLSTHFWWGLSGEGYVYGKRRGNRGGRNNNTIYLARLVAMAEPGQVVAYRNGNKLDCRSCNVVAMTMKQRLSTRQGSDPHERAQRMKPRPSSGMYGITKMKDGWYQVTISRVYFGSYRYPQDAATVWNREAPKVYGPNCPLNVV